MHSVRLPQRVPYVPAIAASLLGLLLLAGGRPCIAEQATPTPAPPPAAAEPGGEPVDPRPQIRRLPNGLHGIGAVVLDRRARSFQVPGRVIRIEPPLEFLAVIEGGAKAYESLLELQANAYEINVAALLIGLDPKRARRPEHHFDPAPAEGDRVRIRVAWQEGETRRDVAAHELLAKDGNALTSGDWAYTGSRFLRGGGFLAQMDGTVIGFSHDPASLIEHVQGVGLNEYGSIGGMAGVAPAVGTEVTVTIEKIMPAPADGQTGEGGSEGQEAGPG